MVKFKFCSAGRSTFLHTRAICENFKNIRMGSTICIIKYILEDVDPVYYLEGGTNAANPRVFV